MEDVNFSHRHGRPFPAIRFAGIDAGGAPGRMESPWIRSGR